MPIAHLSQRFRLQQLGRVRLGHKETNTGGKTYPVADPYFRLPDELVAVCGEQPTSLDICFLSDDPEQTFPNYLRYYTAAGLRCMGDGENIIYRVGDNGVVDVSDAVALDANGRQVYVDGKYQRTPCAGENCPHYLKAECKATGYLRFMVQALPRQGYYDLVCHQRAIVRIRTTLLLTLQMFGRLTDIPFVLHRGEEEAVPVKTAKGTVDMKVRIPWIEVNPEWFGKQLSRRQAVLQESVQLKRLAAGIAEVQTFVEPDDEAAYDGEVVDGEAEVLPPVTDKPAPEQSEPHAKTTQPTQRKLGNGALEAIANGLARRNLTEAEACKMLKVDTIEAGFALAKGSVSTFWDMLTEAQEAAKL